MNNGQLNIFKPLGKTALEMIELLKEKYPEYSNQKISYAGRLDPLASGVLILLIGEKENKARREREKSDKEYSFTMVFGIKTDSFDVCGLPIVNTNIPSIEDVKNVIPEFIGNIKQKIPIYSAYRVRGKPMYVLAAQGKLKDSDVPTIDREIFSIDILDHKTITGEELFNEIKNRLDLITRGDFRQTKILEMYSKILNKNNCFLIVNAKAHVSSGTYIRSLCNDIGEALNANCVSLEIQRTRSGEYNIKNSLIL